MDLRDPVSVLFPGYTAAGTEVLLLSDKYHTNSEGEVHDSDIKFDEDSLGSYCDSHMIGHYIQRIQPKIKDSILISYSERMKYK